MACSITLKGLDFTCKDNVGGLKRVWLADWSAADLTFVSSSKTVTFSSTAFKLYRFRTGNASMTSTLNADEANGTCFVQTDLNMKFTKYDTDMREEAAQILKGNVAAIVEDNNGHCWALGLEHPLTLSAGSVQTGAAMGDMNGLDITVQDFSSTLPYEANAQNVADLPGWATNSTELGNKDTD